MSRLRCSECGRVFETWPQFHFWFTRGGNHLICQGTRFMATPVEETKR